MINIFRLFCQTQIFWHRGDFILTMGRATQGDQRLAEIFAKHMVNWSKLPPVPNYLIWLISRSLQTKNIRLVSGCDIWPSRDFLRSNLPSLFYRFLFPLLPPSTILFQWMFNDQRGSISFKWRTNSFLGPPWPVAQRPCSLLVRPSQQRHTKFVSKSKLWFCSQLPH